MDMGKRPQNSAKKTSVSRDNGLSGVYHSQARQEDKNHAITIEVRIGWTDGPKKPGVLNHYERIFP